MCERYKGEDKRPKCECGEFLLLDKSFTDHNYYTITRDGTRTSKKQHPDNLREHSNYNENYICDTCGEKFEIEVVKDLRVRGKKIN